MERIEQQIAQLETVAGENTEAHRQLKALHERVNNLRRQVTAAMSAWQKTELARHAQRPYLLDYVSLMFTDFDEIHGDRRFGDDPAMICGMALFAGRADPGGWPAEGARRQATRLPEFWPAEPGGIPQGVCAPCAWRKSSATRF